MVLRRYQQVANAGFTHVAHLLVVDTALGPGWSRASTHDVEVALRWFGSRVRGIVCE
jgi:hypothetical protein